MRRVPLAAFAGLAIATVAAVVGIGKLLVDMTADSARPPGWNVFRNDDEGFALALPSGWRVVNEETPDILIDLNALAGERPWLGAFIEPATSGPNPRLKLVAFDLAPERRHDDVLTNVHVTPEPSGRKGFESWSEALVRRVESKRDVVPPVEHEHVDLPAGRALELRYRRLIVGDAERPRITTAVTQYAVAKDGRGYLLTFTAAPERAAKLRDVFAQSAASFRIVPRKPAPSKPKTGDAKLLPWVAEADRICAGAFDEGKRRLKAAAPFATRRAFLTFAGDAVTLERETLTRLRAVRPDGGFIHVFGRMRVVFAKQVKLSERMVARLRTDWNDRVFDRWMRQTGATSAALGDFARSLRMRACADFFAGDWTA